MTEVVGGAGGHDGDGEEADADDAEREEEAGEVAGERTQGLRGVGGGGDGVMAGGEEGGGGGKDDEEHDDVGEEHAEDNVPEAGFEGCVGGAAALAQGDEAGFDFFLDLFIGLPGVEVGGEGGADDGDEDGEKVAIELDVGDEGSAGYGGHLGMRQAGGDDVGEQRHGKHAEDVADEGVGAPELQGKSGERNAEHDKPLRKGKEDACGGGHSADVGAGLDGVADNDAGEDGVEQPAGGVPAEDGEESLAGDLAEFAGEVDDGDHHGEGDGGGPKDGVAELRAGLGVGADGGAIVVGGAGDEAEAERAEHRVLAGAAAGGGRCFVSLGCGHSGGRVPSRCPLDGERVGRVGFWVGKRKATANEPWLLADTDGLLCDGARDFFEACSFAAQAAQVEELGATDLVAADLFDLVDDLGVEGEDALDALAEAHLADGEGALCAAAAGDDHAFKSLEALFLAFLDLDLNANGVARRERGEVCPLVFRGQLLHDWMD